MWYRDKDLVAIGGVRRYHLRYQSSHPNEILYFRLKNIEKTSIRAIHILNGPFILYCHVIPWNYHHNSPLAANTSRVTFDHQVKPGQTMNVPLVMDENSRIENNTYGWKVDIISQIVITNYTSVVYDVMVGNNLEQMKKLNHGSFMRNTPNVVNKCLNPDLTVIKYTQDDIWATPPDIDTPVHLVILTHGIFSNLTADMLYLKETLETSVSHRLLIKGFEGNAGNTEGGVKKLGTKQGKYLIELIDDVLRQGISILKVSFIGHSLGGLVQLYAIKYILDYDPLFFVSRSIRPHNMVFMATPLLGILNEINFVFSWFLDIGTLGKTGRDLTLARSKLRGKPVLGELPHQLHEFLHGCDNLIIYANVINDGIVPLRTSALLYLDYATLDNVRDLQHHLQGDAASASQLSNYKELISLNFNLTKKKHEKLQRKIMAFNTKGSSVDDSDSNWETDQRQAEKQEYVPTVNIPPKASVIQSALSTIICPVPTPEYIHDPDLRASVIFHEKFYDYKDIPEDKVHGMFSKSKKQVLIARQYHRELNWRKVLVRLPSDAHNNIIVRRRFANGYGWGVIDHLALVFNDTQPRDQPRDTESKLELTPRDKPRDIPESKMELPPRDQASGNQPLKSKI